MALTFLVVSFAWIFFRSPSTAEACAFISHITAFDSGQNISSAIPLSSLPFLALGFVLVLFKSVFEEWFSSRIRLKTAFIWGLYIVIGLLSVLSYSVGQDFIYAAF